MKTIEELTDTCDPSEALEALHLFSEGGAMEQIASLPFGAFVPVICTLIDEFCNCNDADPGEMAAFIAKAVTELNVEKGRMGEH